MLRTTAAGGDMSFFYRRDFVSGGAERRTVQKSGAIFASTTTLRSAGSKGMDQLPANGGRGGTCLLCPASNGDPRPNNSFRSRYFRYRYSHYRQRTYDLCLPTGHLVFCQPAVGQLLCKSLFIIPAIELSNGQA